MSLKIPFLLTVFICCLLIISGSYALPIQADEKIIPLAGGIEESANFNLVVEELGSKTADVNELSSMQFVNDAQEDSAVVAETLKAPSLGSGWWKIILSILGICLLLISTLIYLIKRKKI